VSADPTPWVTLAKGLALGRLSMSAAASCMYEPQGGELEVPRGMFGLDQALHDYNTVLMAVAELEPEALEGVICDVDMERQWSLIIAEAPEQLLRLADFYAQWHAARVTLLLARGLGDVGAVH